MTAIKEAVELTTKLIDRRTGRYRNLVIGVAGIGVVCPLLAAVTFSFAPLSGLAAILPLCAGFVWMDILILNQWRERIFQMWLAETLDLNIFLQTLNTIRALPRKTITGITDSLAPVMAADALDMESLPARKAAALACQTLNRCYAGRAAGLSLSGSLCLFSIMWAFLGFFVAALGGIGVALVSYAACQIVIFIRISRLGKSIRVIGESKELSEDALIKILKAMDWGAVPERQKDRFFRRLVRYR